MQGSDMYNIAVKEILIYPVKSLGAVMLSGARIAPKGFTHDRRYLLVDEDGNFLTQRQYPEMGLFRPLLLQDLWKVTAPGSEDSIQFDLVPPGDPAPLRVKVWSDYCSALPYPQAINDWFSEKLGRTCTLVFMPENHFRPISQDKTSVEGSLSFADGYPFLVTTTASLEELNRHLPKQVSGLRFRPNIVLEGELPPFAEDNWTHFSIGQAKFKGIGPHGRCKVVDLDPLTAEADGIVLPALAAFRKQDKKLTFGLSTVCLNASDHPQIKIGDHLQLEG